MFLFAPTGTQSDTEPHDKERKCPLKDMPLRQPGESLDDQILDGALDGLLSSI